uniref:CW domain-containing protein n=1 Tax=Caenorhabditis tropicalis TaxID=1561998 RepID=A0A1I7UBM0_9PELO
MAENGLIHNTTPNCDYYIIGQVATVEKMTSDSIVAFRLPSTDTCPMLEPLLMEGTVQSTAQIQDQSIQYNVTLENDVWTFSPINFTLSCPSPTAKLITRGNMNLCMDVVQTSECINRPDAANACGNLGIPSTLMGIGSWDENEFVRVSAMNILNNQKTPITYSTLGIWLDGTRKSTCMPPAKKSPTCDGANEFDFWDPYCQSPVFQWRPSQPDGLTGSGSDADCLFFRVSNIPGDVAGVGDMP